MSEANEVDGKNITRNREFFYDRNIIKENTLIDFVKYIHNNPVRKGLVDEPGKWYYSSYNCWMNAVDEPLRIDKETWPLF